MNQDEIIKALECWIKNFDGKVTDFKTLCEAALLIKKLIEELDRSREEKIVALRSTVESAKANARADTVQKMADILLEDIERALESNYKVIREHGDKDSEPIRELVNRVKGKIDALRGIEDLIHETVDKMLESKK